MSWTTGTWHYDEFEDVCALLHASTTHGHTTNYAKKQLVLNGKNKFTLLARKSKWHRYFSNCFHGAGIVLCFNTIGSFILCYLIFHAPGTGDPIEFAIIGLVFLLMFGMSGYLRHLQDNDDFVVTYAFMKLMPMYCTVLRDGHKQIIRAVNLVVGDILHVTVGDRIAADVRFFEAYDLEVNNVALTGFSTPFVINPDMTNHNKWLARNLGFACSHVVKGHGKGLVIACGDDTEVGIMAKLSMEPRLRSRSRKHIAQAMYFTHVIGVIIFFLLICTIPLEGINLRLLLEFIMSLTITLTPIYLPMLMYYGLLHTQGTLLKKGCLVRNMESASTLGLTTVICCGLAGTMTMRSWRVSEIYVNGELHYAEYLHLADIETQFMRLIEVAVLCNRASFTPGQRNVPRLEKTVDGGDYDKAVFKFCTRVLPNIQLFRRHFKRLAAKAYDTVSHLQLSVHSTRDNQILLLIRGYWSVVLNYCTTCFIHDTEVPLDDGLRKTVSSMGIKLKKAGRHTYAYGSKVLQPDEQLLGLISDGFSGIYRYRCSIFMTIYCNSLKFHGLISTYDPPSFNVRHGIDCCRSAGIKIVLLTRTDLNFSTAIARAVGIIGRHSETVDDVANRLGIPQTHVTGNMVTAAAIDMKNWHKKLHHQRWDARQLLLSHADLVFANIGVKQRYMLVDVCQKLGSVVTVVGTSVHDTSAIRRANVGVAPGAASQASKFCADMILQDSNFITLVNAIAESRLLFENIRKALTYTLSSTMAMVLIHLSFLVLRIPFRLFLIVSLVLDYLVKLLPALTLFYEPAEEDIMKHKPKIYNDFLVNRRIIFVAYIQTGLVEATAVFISYFVYMSRNGFLPRTLIGLSIHWYDESVNDLIDSYGQEWTRDSRKKLEYRTTTVVIITFIIMHSVNLVLAKTGRVNLFKHGFGNMRLNFAVIYLICLAFLFSVLDCPKYLYILPVNYFPVFNYIWPLILLNIFLECLRRYLIMHFPGSWLEEETYYGYNPD